MRHARPEDVPVLVALGREMHAEATALNHAPFVFEKVAAALGHAMTNGLVLVHADDIGEIDAGFAGIVHERWYSNVRMFVDLALFVKADRRGGIAAFRLLDAALTWCQEQGLDPRDVLLGTTTGIDPERTGQFYRRMGFREIGALYQLGGY